MTGGMAFVYDEEKQFEKVNPETVVWQKKLRLNIGKII